MSRRHGNESIVCLTEEGIVNSPAKSKNLTIVVSDTRPSHIASILNSHFASIYNKLSSKLPQSSHYLAVYFLQTSFLKFSAPVIQYEVQFEILFIPNNKAHECIGLYSCPSRILNSDSSILSYLLANIFYTLIDYSPRLKRIIVLVYKHEVISTKSERKPLKSTI